MKKKTIFVIGYPKSGNTWMTRLLSQALNIKVAKMGIHGYPEVASDTNDHLDKKNVDNRFQIVKTHDNPETIRKYLSGDTLKGVYIIRDFRDVLVSSIFYFNSNKYFLHFLSSKLKGKINTIIKYFLDEKIHNFTSETINGDIAHKIIWDDHIKAWEREKKRKNSKICFVKYEELKKDPEKAVKRVINGLGEKVSSGITIKEVVEFQSFNNTKKRTIKDDNLNKINSKLMRRGGTGDWKKILPLKTIDLINNKFSQELKRWEYIK